MRNQGPYSIPGRAGAAGLQRGEQPVWGGQLQYDEPGLGQQGLRRGPAQLRHRHGQHCLRNWGLLEQGRFLPVCVHETAAFLFISSMNWRKGSPAPVSRPGSGSWHSICRISSMEYGPWHHHQGAEYRRHRHGQHCLRNWGLLEQGPWLA